MLRVLANALAASADPALGLLLGKRMHVSAYGMLGYTLLASRNLGEALRLAIAHPALLGTYSRLELQTVVDEVRLSASGYRYDPALSLFNTELCLASMLTVVQDLLGESVRPRRLLLADASVGRLALLREIALDHYEVLFEQGISQLHDLQLLPDGALLFQSDWHTLVEVDPQSGERRWSYDARRQNRPAGEAEDAALEVHSFERLPDGSTLIAESGRRRLIWVDREGRLLHQVPLWVERPDAHHDTRLVRTTPAGTVLVAHEADGVVREYDREGRVVWSYGVPLFGQEPAPGHGPQSILSEASVGRPSMPTAPANLSNPRMRKRQPAVRIGRGGREHAQTVAGAIPAGCARRGDGRRLPFPGGADAGEFRTPSAPAGLPLHGPHADLWRARRAVACPGRLAAGPGFAAG